MFKKCLKLALICLAVIPTLLVILALTIVSGLNLAIGNIFALLLGLVVMLPISILVHELGHFVAARAARLHVITFAAWPLLIMRTEQGFRLTWDFRPSLVFGRVVATPRDLRPVRWRMMTLIAGGPLATLLMVLLCAALAQVPIGLQLPRWWGAWDTRWVPAVLTSWLTLAALVNALLLLASLTPEEMITPTDGALLIDWLFGGLDVRRATLLLSIGTRSRTGVRARDWDAELIERLLAEPSGSREDVGAHLYGYYHAVDRGEVERAGELLDYALARRDKYSADYRSALTLEGAYYEGFFRRDAAKARSWFNYPGAQKTEEQTRLRAEAAVLFAENDWHAAAAKAEAGLAVVMNSEDAGGAISERDWLAAILEECRRQMAAQSLTASPPVPRS